MRAQGASTRWRRPKTALALAVTCALLAAGAAGCGGDEEIASEPRPPAPTEVTASIKDRAVDVSPAQVGAGIANITVANLTNDPVRLTLTGPVDDATEEIAPRATARLRTDLEPGTYQVTAGEGSNARPSRLEVGPARPSAQNELLLP